MMKNQAGLISAASAPVPYLFDQTAPTGSIVQPVPAAAVASRKPVFQVSAADSGAGVQSVAFQYRPAGSTAEFTTISVDGTPQQGLYEALWTDISLPDGAYEFRAWVTDRAGNQTLLGPTEVIVDLQVPTVELQFPSAEGIAYTESPTPPFIAAAADAGAGPGVAPSGVAQVDFRFRLKSGLPAPPWTAADFTLLWSDDSPAYGANWGTTQLADGDYVFAVQAVDRAGNPSALATQEVIVDRAPPEVRSFGPAARARLPDNTPYQLTWEIFDVSAVETVKLEYSADGGATWQLLAAAVPNTGSFAWSVPDVVDADNPNFKVRLTATDAAGPAVGDVAGHTTEVVSPAFTVAEAPAPATGLAAGDPDQTSTPPSLDGRDFRLEWTPSPSTDVAVQHIYILPVGTPLDLDPGSSQTPVADPGAADSSWTGSETLTKDSLGTDFALDTAYDLYVVTKDSVGAQTPSAPARWPAGTPPAAPTGVSAADPDTTSDVDGRDFQAAWTPSVGSAVVQQRIYLLPAAVPLVLTGGSAHVPVDTLTGNSDAAWTGPATLTVDSAGNALAPGDYHIYVVAVDDDGRMSASAPAALTVADP
ncbi:MAG: Ig-like domain repeat protein [Actinobacteria bacterium]|nr:Ig-like domain repeat protein [Actinomycetota bacterium]